MTEQDEKEKDLNVAEEAEPVTETGEAGEAGETEAPKADKAASKKEKAALKEKDKKIAQLENELAEAHKEIRKRDDVLVEAQNKLNRLLGEFDNLKKRTQREKESVHDDTVGEIMTALLPVLDTLESAASVEQNPELAKGIVMTLNAFRAVMEQYHVSAFGETGDPFDPEMHNAVAHIENEELGENVISMVFRKGYRVGDRVIRPAMVQVAN
ncbi:MAG: nucleotide exchange factor GrpE [Clostridia bacterium]|nr:nucleotide exchange factor GrpE [Clostridia bacterium]